MTRGQESLVMELEPAPAVLLTAEGVPVERARLPLIAATEDEAAEHAKVLQEIQAESKGKCVWLKLETPGAG